MMKYQREFDDRLSTIKRVGESSVAQIENAQYVPRNVNVIKADNYPADRLEYPTGPLEDVQWLRYGVFGDFIVNSDNITVLSLDADITALNGGCRVSYLIDGGNYHWAPGDDDGLFYYAPSYTYRQHLQIQHAIRLPKGRYTLNVIYQPIGNASNAVVYLTLSSISVGVRSL